ncbi:hypothetical protein BS78_05G173700 [Paspalum vaginatum]|nr:hypothetical protein BS78_05G173700 [Paspalum vaginatum]
MAAASSSGAGVTARGIRILDSPQERRSPPAPWVSLGVDGFHGEEEEEEEAPLPRARGCDVYVGYGDGVRRMVAWLRAELEMLGVPCAALDRRRLGNAAARAAMDAAMVGVVVVTPVSLASPHAVEEIRAFLARGALVPVFVGVTRRDVVAEDVVEGRGHQWGAHGGRLWKAYGGDEAEWREAVEGLASAEPAVEVRVGDLRGSVFDVLEILGARLGRRAVALAISAWRAAADTEIPFQWNTGFVGRETELVELESTLRGGARALDKAAGKRPVNLHGAFSEGSFLDCVAVCVSGASGAGKTELALEFAHRHSHEYKKVLWVHGEARYLRQSYLKLADHLGVSVGDSISPSSTPADRARRRLHEIEGGAIAKVKKELTRDIPYLLVIDNLESERDWWDRRPLKDLLPLGARRTHVIVTTRLGGLHGTRTLELGNLDAPNAMRLMQGTRTFSDEDMAVLGEIHEKVRGVTLGLALVGAILSQVDIGPGELRGAMNDAPHRAPTWASNDDPTLRDNPGLVRLLDACFALAGREAAGLGAVAERLLEASSFFAPAPIPTAMLLRAAGTSASGETLWKRFRRTMALSCASPHAASHEQDALAALLRLGIARRSTHAGCISLHSVFRLFGRKVGSGRVARAVVQAIAAEGGGGAQHADHTWAACMSLFGLGAPAMSVELPPLELVCFVTRCVLPLAARCVAGYSAYSAALELLREATDGVLQAEDRYIGSPRRSNGSSYVELDPKVYQNLARARAELLVTRARMMVRAGERDIAEDHCLSAISILEVVSGDCHPDTLAVRAFLEEAVRV